MSVLRKLYQGEVFPQESIKIKENDNYKEIIRQKDKISEYFKSILSKEDNYKIDDLIQLIYAEDSYDTEESFVLGFKLAVEIMSEVLSNNNEIKHFLEKLELL